MNAHENASASLEDPTLYLNRELSFLDFDQRVLELAQDESVPLLERVRLLAISSTNLDEFFEIRVSGLKQLVQHGLARKEPDGATAAETLAAVSRRVRRLVASQYSLLKDHLLPALAREGIRIPRREQWDARTRRFVRRFFREQVLPVLSPIALDPAHPFPRILNKSLNFIVELAGRDAFGRETRYAVLQVPRALPRVIPVGAGVRGSVFVLLSSVVHAHVGEVFPGMRVVRCHQFRVTRDSDLWVDEEEIDDLKRALEGELPRRKFGAAVRLEVADDCPDETASFLLERFGLEAGDLYPCAGPVNLNRIAALVDLADRPDLRHPPFVPGPALDPESDPFETLRRGDVLLHHPYQSFAPVVDLLRRAAGDPDVLAIRQTLYRTGADSPIVDALVEAARAGKEVTVLVELRARFDEADNIRLAERLQEAGAKVGYGVVGHKTHAKALLLVRREGARLRRYVHLGTGNYHHRTAQAYTDVALLSADPALGEDLHRLFLHWTGAGAAPRVEKIVAAPFALRDWLLERIAAEAEHARAGRPACIVARMNALTEPSVIRALYEASAAGVTIDLLVRGVCSLRPGVRGVSERIRVRSVLGRFLEHSRVFHFANGGDPRTFLSSADWMQRNLRRRVETAVPIEDPALARRLVEETLELPLADRAYAWTLRSDGRWQRLPPGATGSTSSQQVLLDRHALPV